MRQRPELCPGLSERDPVDHVDRGRESGSQQLCHRKLVEEVIEGISNPTRPRHNRSRVFFCSRKGVPGRWPRGGLAHSPNPVHMVARKDHAPELSQFIPPDSGRFVAGADVWMDELPSLLRGHRIR
ncbi:protein of unknown function [Kyrpidia spormannii]|uniref:Uncharacterized protein n=1 Tax=Kyrpidia spormannii TaxID=2055160 RepID=A0A6F9E6E6_9BACL|nr:protein of unknown function [Kyrpidia spormannii]